MKKVTFVILFSILSFCSFTQGLSYYVSPSGDDNNNGTTIASAWKTINKANNFKFLPGDALLFEGGHIFYGNLVFSSEDEGSASNSITISSYGNGKAVVHGTAGDAIFINNTEYINIKNIIVKGNGRYNNNGTGIYVEINTNAKMLRGIVIDEVEASGFYYSGIGIGIHTGITKGFENLRITNCIVYENGFAGIQTSGAWDDVTGTSPFNHKGMYIANVKAYKNHGLKNYTYNWSGTGILMAGVENGIIENCEAYENGADNGCSSGGPVGIWLANTKNCIIQNCESYNNKAGKSKDGGGFDIDGGAQDCVIQYCYSHDNEGPGYAFFEWGNNIPFTGNIIRYNISQNDARNNSYGSLTFWGVDANHKILNSEVYNNTIYVSKENLVNGTPSAVKFMGMNIKGLKIRNNIFYVTEGVQMVNSTNTYDTTTIHFQNNNYYDTSGNPTFVYQNTYKTLSAWKAAARGQEMRGNKSFGFSKDPKFVNPGGGTTIKPSEGGDLTYMTAYMLHPSSEMIDAGLNLKHEFGLQIGRKDYYNNTIDEIELFDLGANEFNPAKFIVMPLEFTSMNAYNNGSDIVLKWNVETTENVKEFNIEISKDGVNFKAIRSIRAEDEELQSYEAFLNKINEHQVYLRIKGITQNNRTYYSKVIQVASKLSVEVKAYPNPAKNQLYISNTNGFKKLIVRNLQNHIVLVKDNCHTESIIQLDVKNLQHGIYFSELLTNEGHKKVIFNFIKL